MLAHVYTVDAADGVPDLAPLMTAGIGGFVQNMQPVEVDCFDRALVAIIVGPGSSDDESSAVGVRWIGEQSGHLVIVDLLAERSDTFALALDDVAKLFADVRVVLDSDTRS